MNCSVCYDEFFSSDELTPRTLPCGHICCTRCLTEMFDAEGVMCPECFQFAPCGAVDELRVSDEREYMQSEIQDEEPASPSHSENGQASDQRTCLVTGCEKERTTSGYCTFHGTRTRLSLSFASEVADKMKSASLDSVVLEKDRIKMKNDEGWPSIDPHALIERFRLQKRMVLGEALDLIERARNVLRKEPNILQLSTPIIAVGDIHGQFFDLLNLLEVGGAPGKDTSYLFLGDYVDRGKFSCEVILTLLALKVTYPDKIWLIRGNHECRSTTTHFGFKEECKMKYGSTVYSRLLLCFETMPVCAVVHTEYGNIFACHGGISPSLQTLEQIEQIDRFVEPDMQGALCDILWADPINEADVRNMTDAEYQEFLEIDWRPNPIRGCSYCFGYKAIKEFLAENNLLCMIRAHEVQESGFARHFDPATLETRLRKAQKALRKQSKQSLMSEASHSMEEESSSYSSDSEAESVEFPPVITIFSAPNYCDRYGNKAAILRIDSEVDGFRVLQYDCVPHPEPDDNESQDNKHLLAMIKTCPYMPTTFRDFVRLAVELGPADGTFDDLMSEDELEDEETRESVHSVEAAAVPSPAKSESNDIHTVDDVADELLLDENEGNDTTISPGGHREILISTKHRSSISHPEGPELGSRMMSPRRSEVEDAPPVIPSALSALVAKEQGIEFDEAAMLSVQSITQRWPREQGGASSRNRQRASTYRLAAARDGINEMHPEILEKRIQQLDGVGLFPEELESQSYGPHEVPDEEKPLMSVADIRRRFERKGSVSHMQKPGPQTTPDYAEMREVFSNGRSVSVSQLRRLFEANKRSSKETMFGSNTTEASSGTLLQSIQETHDHSEGNNVEDASHTNGATANARSTVHATTEDNSDVESHASGTTSVETVSRSATPDEAAGAEAGGEASTLPRRKKSSLNRIHHRNAGHIAFTRDEIIGLKLMFTLLDISGDGYIELDEFIAFAEESGDYSQIREAKRALEIVDVDKDGRMGLLDYIHFAARLKDLQEVNRHASLMQELRRRSSTSSDATS